MKTYRKIIAILLAVGLVLPGAGLVAMADTVEKNVTRLSGDDRYETAVAVSEEAYKTADAVVLAGGMAEVDALTGTLLAAAKEAPLLYTNKAALTAATKAEIAKLAPTTVYVLGGKAAVEEAVVTELETLGYTVKRVEGLNRQATAAAVAEEANFAKGHAFIVRDGVSSSLVDALAVAPASYKMKSPVFLTKHGALHPETKEALKGYTSVTVIGGETAVSKAVETELTEMGLTVNTRVAGLDRDKTAVAIANKYFAGATQAVLANGHGKTLVDALVGGYLGGMKDAPVLYTKVDQIPTVTADFVEELNSVYMLGGTTVMSAALETAVGKLLEVDELKVVSVSAINAKELIVKFNTSLDKVSAENAANYALEVSSTPAAFTVEFDKNTPNQVKLVSTNPIANDSVVKVTVKKGLLASGLNALEADFTEVFVSSDKVAPSVAKIEKSGSDVVVTFNEEISGTIGLVKFNNTTYAAAGYSVVGKKLTITGAAANLSAGNYQLVLNGVSDLVPTLPNTTGLLTTTLTVTADTLVPTVTKVAQVGDDLVRVTFNKPVSVVAGATPVVVTKNGYQLTLSGPTTNATGTEYTYQVLDNGTVKVYDTGFDTSAIAVKVNGFKDANGTIANQFTQSLTLSKDKTAPVLVNRFNEINDLQTSGAADEVFDIYFNEEIALVDAVNAANNVVLTDKNGIRQTVSGVSVVNDANSEAKILRVASTAVQTAGVINAGEYTITLPSGLVKDTSMNANKNLGVSVKFTKSGAAASGVTASASAGANVITVAYGSPMSNSATIAANYQLDGKALPAGTVVYFDTNNQTVKIELPDSSVAVSGGAVLTILDNVVSTTGVKVDKDDKYISIASGFVDNVDPVLSSAKKTSTSQLELTFSEAVQLPGTASDAIDDFIVTINGVEVTPTSIATGTAGNKLVLTLPTYNTSQEVRVTVDASATIDVTDGANSLTTGTVVVAQ